MSEVPRGDVTGRWVLAAFESRGEDGTVGHPLGPGVVGGLIYLDDGWFSAYIEGTQRPRFGTADPRGGTAEQIIEAFRTCIAYMGRWRLEGPDVVHTVEFASLPDWVGGEQRRTLAIVSGELILRTPPMVLDGVVTVNELRWHRP
jgi:hypothetical protein